MQLGGIQLGDLIACYVIDAGHPGFVCVDRARHVRMGGWARASGASGLRRARRIHTDTRPDRRGARGIPDSCMSTAHRRATPPARPTARD